MIRLRYQGMIKESLLLSTRVTRQMQKEMLIVRISFVLCVLAVAKESVEYSEHGRSKVVFAKPAVPTESGDEEKRKRKNKVCAGVTEIWLAFFFMTSISINDVMPKHLPHEHLPRGMPL